MISGRYHKWRAFHLGEFFHDRLVYVLCRIIYHIHYRKISFRRKKLFDAFSKSLLTWIFCCTDHKDAFPWNVFVRDLSSCCYPEMILSTCCMNTASRLSTGVHILHQKHLFSKSFSEISSISFRDWKAKGGKQSSYLQKYTFLSSKSIFFQPIFFYF